MPRTTTAYNLVAETIREDILAGRYRPGQQLPPERELCDAFEASRITIRRAMEILEEEFLVRRQQGSGTYVSPRPTRKIPILTTDFAGSIADHAPALQRRLDTWGWRKATAEIADRLQLPRGGRVLFARRIDSLQQRPVAYDELFLPESVAGRLTPKHLSALDFTGQWSQAQRLVLSHSRQIIDAVAAAALAARLLRVKTGAPLLRETDLFFVEPSRPVGFVESYYRCDMVRLVSTVSAQGENPE